VEDEIVIVQGVEVEPKNTKLQRHVYFSPQQKKYFRAPLPAGFDQGDFSADLRALIISLKYCGTMSEPKIGEFLENFDVQVSAGSKKWGQVLTYNFKAGKKHCHGPIWYSRQAPVDGLWVSRLSRYLVPWPLHSPIFQFHRESRD
jgi:hypothetical protein